MDVLDVIKKVEDSDVFKELGKDNYLVHLFSITDIDKRDEWQIGYYSKKSDKITVFDCIGEDVKIMPAEEAFKEKNYIAPLNVDKIKISREDASNIVNEVVKKNYSAETITKSIILLQNLPEYGQIWNISIITTIFNVLNIKINAESGEVIKHTRESLLGWNKS